MPTLAFREEYDEPVGRELDRVLAALNKTSVQGLATHLADTDNPHQTTAAQVGAYPSSSVVASTYTPTVTPGTNVAAATAYACQYLRVGSIVTVSGRVDVDPTGIGACELGLSLPVASDLTAGQQLAGTGAAPAVAGMVLAVLGDASNNRASFQWVAVDTANRAVYFTFTYRIV